jgi:AraC family cel operon transcriptional repressor
MPALARLAKRSPEHVAREFRRYLNWTPTDVINDARMSYAADRLAASDDKITTIALDCGLENLGHFYRLFQARYGCTPRAYRVRQNPAEVSY